MRIRSLRQALALLLAWTLLLLSVPLTAPTPAAADMKDGDGTWTVNGYYDIIPYGVWDRGTFAAHLDVLRHFGFNENFVWYSSDDSIVVQRYDQREMASWHQLANWTGRWVYDRYFTKLNNEYYAGATFHVWTYGGSFVEKVCGNHTPYAVNPNPPRISGYKWNDLNQNGSWDNGEPAMNGWKINVYRQGTYMGSVTTNQNGYWEFVVDATQGRTPGTYTMTEDVKPNWVQTAGPSAVYVQPGAPDYNYGGNNFGNYRGGTIAGQKWIDRDGDGVRDAEDVGASGWTILAKRGTDATITAQTGSGGSYQFGGLSFGTYVVSEQPPAGWMQTYPRSPAAYTVQIQSGSNVSGIDFGNAQLGSIRPLKIHDLNANGAWDQPDERPLAGWTMRMSGPVSRDSIVTTGDTVTTPRWDRLLAGQYRVWEDPSEHPEYEPTGPTEQTVNLGVGQNVDVPFFNVLTGDIHGVKFHDLNGDHVREDEELGIEKWSITLTYPDGHEETTLTASDGSYRFGHLLPGHYRVSEESRKWWQQTTAVAQGVDLVAGGSVGVSFGNLLVGDIEGYKFHDRNANGVKDDGEPTADVEVRLSKLDGTPVGEPTTTVDGKYAFTGLIPGTYLVTETVPHCWKCTASKTVTVTVEGGKVNLAPCLLNVKYATLSGSKFDDSNANGRRDPGEQGISGWGMTLQVFEDGSWTDATQTVTQADGTYAFDELLPGRYRVVEEERAHWKQTDAPEGPVDLLGGDEVSGQDFGNLRLASLDLYKWDDSNSNGVWESNEATIPGWGFRIAGDTITGEHVSIVATTGADGKIALADLMPGSYRAVEQSVGLALDPSGRVTEPGWRAVTPDTATISLGEGSAEATSFGNIHLGWVWGRVTHEVYGTPIADMRIELAETGEVAYTNADGYYFFYSEEPNNTSETPTPDYLVGMDLTGTGWKTRGPVDKSVVVPEGGQARADFAVYEDTCGNQPRTIGYWKNWSNHYSQAEMQALVDKVRLGSDEFANLTVADVYKIVQVDKKTGMREKARAQFLAFWLNVASGNLGFSTTVNVSPIGGWQTIVTSADSAGHTDVIGLLFDMEAAFLKQWTQSAWETIKNVLDALNNGQLT